MSSEVLPFTSEWTELFRLCSNLHWLWGHFGWNLQTSWSWSWCDKSSGWWWSAGTWMVFSSLTPMCFTVKQRFDNLSPIKFEFWHASMYFLNLVCSKFFRKSSSDKGTFEGEGVPNHIDNIKVDVKNNYDQDIDFFLSFLNVGVGEALCPIFGMKIKLDNPTKHSLDVVLIAVRVFDVTMHCA